MAPRLYTRLRKERASRKMSRQALADALQISTGYLSQLESGDVQPGPDLRQRIESWLAAKPSAKSAPGPSKKAVSGDRVFIVHGHDDAAKEKAARLVTTLGLRPIILHEQPNEGRTIIEKFEDHADDTAFAIVLLSPDDVGEAKAKATNLKPRARQNVIFELGFFVAAIGRARVCALHIGDVEILSDYSGVLYVAMDGHGAWQTRVAKEMRAIGIDVDLNAL